MCDEGVLNLQKTLQSLGTKVPKIIVQRVDEIFPSLKESMNCMDLVKVELGSYNETCQTHSPNGNQIDIKVEDVADIQEEVADDPFPVIKVEQEHCMDLVKVELGSYNETYQTHSLNGNQIDIKVEDVADIQEEDDDDPFPVVKAEQENCMDLVKVEPGSYNETCQTHSPNGNQIYIKVEDVADIQEEEEEDDPFPVVKAEQEHCMDLVKVELGSYNETCQTHSPNGNQIYIKVEDVADIQEEEDDPFPVIKAEQENCMDLVKVELGSYNETCQTHSPNGNQIYIKVEDFADIREEEVDDPFPVIKAEQEQSTLSEHQVMHSDGKPFSCDLCHESFSLKAHLRIHLRIHSGEWPYSCDVCNKSFRESASLKRHELIHSGERPYSCDVCNKSFVRKGHLKMHLHIHSGERPYSCDVCNKSFLLKGHLKIHLRIHSGDRPYFCDVCNKSFSESGALKRHKRIHSGERPYSCDVCNKSFSESGVLKKHKRIIHTGERPYSCDICNRSFSESSVLKNHQRIHSGESRASIFM